MKNKKVVIAGGLGFIGSSLAKRLVEMGARISVVDSLVPEQGGNLFNIQPFRGKVRVLRHDVRTAPWKELLVGCDYLFNLAGQTSHLDSMLRPFADLAYNCESQLAVLEAVKKYSPRTKVIFTSTRQIYGRPVSLPVDENHPLQPVDINGVHKLTGEWYHRIYHSVYGIPVSILRLTNIFGPGMRIKEARQTFLGLWIRNLLEGRPLVIYGNGAQLRDFVYIEDAVDALLLAAKNRKMEGGIFNLGHNKPVSLETLAKILIDCHGSGRYIKKPFPKALKAIDIGDYYADSARLRQISGWKTRWDLKTALQETLHYYKKFKRNYL